MAILSRVGVKPDMQFLCCDCGGIVTGNAVITGEYLYIVCANKQNPLDGTFRCECCQDEWEERNSE